MSTTKALIVVFDKPIPEEEAEELVDMIECEVIDEMNVPGHVEHFTERRARELMRDDTRSSD